LSVVGRYEELAWFDATDVMNADAALTELMVKAARIEQGVARLRGRGESALGRVRVEVDAEGKITDLHLDAALHGIAPPELARLITAAQHAACVHARTAAEELELELRDDPYAAAVVSEAAAAGLAPETPTPPARTTPLPPRTAARRDDWEEIGPPETWLR